MNRTPHTAGLIKAIQTGRRRLGMQEEDYRAMLADVSGGRTTSTKELTVFELKLVLLRMRKAGFRSTTDDQLRKIRSLWYALWDEGIVQRKDERAIASFIRRITKLEVRECSVKDMQRVIEALKKWIERIEDLEARDRLRRTLLDMPVATPTIQ